ncbi:hypothetical protein JYU02_00435 [bacterium AH-315-P15]|nr:hypothetical protein [bacterium AH-315-P15]
MGGHPAFTHSIALEHMAEIVETHGIDTAPTEITRNRFAAGTAEAVDGEKGEDAVTRAFMALVLKSYLKSRSTEDLRQELINSAGNLDPDYIFMRP